MALSFNPFTSDDTIVLGLWLFETARRIYRRWRRSLARNWPLANGYIEHAEVLAEENRNLNLRYSYSVAGEWYGGELIAPFDDNQQALDFVLRAKGTRISVSVNPDDPTESFIIPEQLAAAKTGLFAGNVDTASPASTLPALQLPVRPVAWLLLGASLCLLVIFLTLHVAALRGRLLFTQNQLTTLIVTSVVAFIATLCLDAWQSKEARLSRRPPTALRWPNYFFGILTGVYFFTARFYPAIRGPLFNRQLLCSFAEFICWGMFLTLYSVLTTRKFSASVGPALHVEAGT